MKCHCSEKLVKHDGMLHCEACGCYYLPDGALAPDHTPCRTALRIEVPVAGSEWASQQEPEEADVADDQPDEPEAKPTRKARAN